MMQDRLLAIMSAVADQILNESAADKSLRYFQLALEAYVNDRRQDMSPSGDGVKTAWKNLTPEIQNAILEKAKEVPHAYQELTALVGPLPQDDPEPLEQLSEDAPLRLPAGLPGVADARLPATYENARTALAQCADIDECKDWADKAAAMASYAKQAGDDTLFKFATRIKARAIDKCGELLRQLPATPGKRTDIEPPMGDHTRSSSPRDQAAHDAGLSKHQKDTALQVNNVPREQFENLVESENPPSVTQLAEMGKKKPEPRKKQKPKKGRKQKPKQRPLVGGGPIIQQCINQVRAIVLGAMAELQGDEVDCLFAALGDALNSMDDERRQAASNGKGAAAAPVDAEHSDETARDAVDQGSDINNALHGGAAS